jgi:hypothetical protein
MSKQETKPTMRTVQLLGYTAATCPHCKKTIFIPHYSIEVGTIEDDKKLREEMKQELGF